MACTSQLLRHTVSSGGICWFPQSPAVTLLLLTLYPLLFLCLLGVAFLLHAAWVRGAAMPACMFVCRPCNPVICRLFGGDQHRRRCALLQLGSSAKHSCRIPHSSHDLSRKPCRCCSHSCLHLIAAIVQELRYSYLRAMFGVLSITFSKMMENSIKYISTVTEQGACWPCSESWLYIVVCCQGSVWCSRTRMSRALIQSTSPAGQWSLFCWPCLSVYQLASSPWSGSNSTSCCETQSSDFQQVIKAATGITSLNVRSRSSTLKPHTRCMASLTIGVDATNHWPLGDDLPVGVLSC